MTVPFMVTVHGLEKRYRSHGRAVPAVNGIDLSIRAGEFFTLLGPSGCGKTTTLNCIAGLETPDDGEINLGDRIVYSRQRRIAVPADRRGVAMVFQSYAIWPHMTVFDNVAFPLVHGRKRPPRHEVRGRVLQALSLVRLDGLAERPAPFLSGGQQQRVALARALVAEPQALLLDEPLSNLDASLREQMRHEIKHLTSRLGLTTVYVTHDQVEAMSMSDRIAVMHQGRVEQIGGPMEIYRRPCNEFVANFVGRTNVLAALVVRAPDESRMAVLDTPLGRLQCVTPAEIQVGDGVQVAIRPAAVDLLGSASQRPAAGANVFRGRVEEAQLVGDFVELQVRVGETVLAVQADAYRDLATGEQVLLSLPPERVVVIPGNAARPGGPRALA